MLQQKLPLYTVCQINFILLKICTVRYTTVYVTRLFQIMHQTKSVYMNITSDYFKCHLFWVLWLAQMVISDHYKDLSRISGQSGALVDGLLNLY